MRCSITYEIRTCRRFSRDWPIDRSPSINSVSKVFSCKSYYWVEFITRLYHLVVCKRVSWSGRLSHDTPAVKGDAHCWIIAEEPKNHPPEASCLLYCARRRAHFIAAISSRSLTISIIQTQIQVYCTYTSQKKHKHWNIMLTHRSFLLRQQT